MNPRAGRLAKFLLAAGALIGAPAVWHGELTPGARAAEPVADPAAAASDWRPDPDSMWSFELRLNQQSFDGLVRGYQTPEGACVILPDVITALDLPIRVEPDGQTAAGWIFEEARTLRIDRAKGEQTVAGQSGPIPAGAIHDTADGWCVDTGQLAGWLGVTAKADLGNSLLQIESKAKLPAQLAAERRARAESLNVKAFSLNDFPRVDRPYRLLDVPSVDVVASVSKSETEAVNSGINTRYELFGSGELLKHSVDARLASDERARPQSLRVRAYRSDIDAGLLGPLEATHYAAGDVTLFPTSLVSGGGFGSGALITNRPINQPDSFDKTDFRGDLPVGWDAELYRNGQLIGSTSANSSGRYEFLDVALQYGDNKFEIVQYGPQGQVQRIRNQVRVGSDAIPANKVWYVANIADQNSDLVRFRDGQTPIDAGLRGTIGFETGLDPRTSIAVYGHSIPVDDRRINFGELSLRRAFGAAFAEGSFAAASDGGLAVRGTVLGTIGKAQVRVEAMRGWNNFISNRFKDETRKLYAFQVDQGFTIGKIPASAALNLRQEDRWTGSSRTEGTFRLSAALRQIFLSGQVDWTRTDSGAGARAEDKLLARMSLSSRVGDVRVRAQGVVGVYGPANERQFDLKADWERSDDFGLRAEVGYDAMRDRWRTAAGLTRRFRPLELTALAGVESNGSFFASLAVAFSLGTDRRGHGLRLSNKKLASTGQVEALVWRDSNGDGVHQDDEPTASNVELTAGRVTVDRSTDKQGRVMIDGLSPYQPVLIGIDATSLDDPYLQPRFPGQVVTPRPGVVTQVQIPLVGAGDVEGELRDAAGNPAGARALELIDQAGRVIATTTSDSDGYFLFERAPYGAYRVRLAGGGDKGEEGGALLSAEATLSSARPAIQLGKVSLPPAAK